MTVKMNFLCACVGIVALTSVASAEPAAKPLPSVPADEELSDDAILTKLFASRDFCQKIDAANAAAYDKGLQMLTADSPDEVKAFKAKADYAAIVAKSVAEFEQRDKDPNFAGFGKGMCENFLKMQ